MYCLPIKTEQPIDLLSLHQQFPNRYPALLDSIKHDQQSDCYDILFAYPQGSLELQNGRLLVQGEIDQADLLSKTTFLKSFDQLWKQQSISPYLDKDYDFLPFKGGWFTFLAYELVSEIETKLSKITLPEYPTAFALRIPAAIIFSHAKQQYYIVAEPQFKKFIDQMRDDFCSLQGQHIETVCNQEINIHEDDEDDYLLGVDKIKWYIKEGDVFQVNLSRQWKGQMPEEIMDAVLYRSLRRHNPAPYAGIVKHGDLCILSSSPERLACVKNKIIQTRPIAGTRPRSENFGEDQAYSAELMSHSKELAEHVMLIDLERNDLGRICEYGSVVVDEKIILESYRHVHHIVSNIRGQLRPNVTPGDCIKALFPGGTITGCPKVRCMEILTELETEPRGAYTGSFGYINHDGSLDLNILIRSIVRFRDNLSIRAGAGIVADSDSQAELNETRSKAKGMLSALTGLQDKS